jgi:hypothetical protein
MGESSSIQGAFIQNLNEIVWLCLSNRKALRAIMGEYDKDVDFYPSSPI